MTVVGAYPNQQGPDREEAGRCEATRPTTNIKAHAQL